MGIFQKIKDFQSQREKKAVEKNLKTIQNPKAIREDRTASIDFFCGLEDPQIAVPALLKRFGYSLDHGIYDTREKETALAGILKHKEKALPLLKEHLKTTVAIAWPLKIIEKICSQAEVLEVLESCLDYNDVSLDADKTDKNYDILCYLRDYQLEGAPEKMAHFLEAHDERIRYAAVEVLLGQQQQPRQIAKALERFLGDFSPENSRLHQTTVEAFEARSWR